MGSGSSICMNESKTQKGSVSRGRRQGEREQTWAEYKFLCPLEFQFQ